LLHQLLTPVTMAGTIVGRQQQHPRFCHASAPEKF